jgi:hypothetical protein
MKKLVSSVFVLVVLIAGQAMAQSKPTAASTDRVKTLFADKTFADAGCKTSVIDGDTIFDCSYRVKGLHGVFPTRGMVLRQDALNADFVMVISKAGALELFPNTAEWFRRLSVFSAKTDFCKVSIHDTSVVISSVELVSHINTPADLKFQFDQVAACRGEFVARFEPGKK